MNQPWSSHARIALRLLVIAAAFSSVANAATFVVYSDRELVRRSDAIVVGSALGSHTQTDAAGAIETVTTFSVEEVIKGGIRTATITVHEPGGRLGDRIKIVPGTPQFEAGERVVLFLKRTREKTWATTDFVLGKFSHATDVAGRKLLVRQEEDIVGFSTDWTRHAEKRRDAARFLDFVRAEARGAMGLENYYVEHRELRSRTEKADLRTETSALSTSAKTYTFSSANPSATAADHAASAGYRWGAFPGAVTFTHHNTGSNTGVASNGISSAMALWNNDCGSNVNLQNGGADVNPVAPLGISGDGDNRNSVRWEIVLGFGATPFNCATGGTIGIGGVNGATGPPAGGPTGDLFWNIVEGDVDMAQNVLGCVAYTSSASFAHGVAHELGHAIGFRHSDQSRSGGACVASASHECSTNAIMKSVVENNLSGLQEYDVNAVRSVYPATCTTASVRNDFSGDGKADILLRHSGTGDLGMWIMNSAAIASSGFVGSPGAYTVGGIGDFGGDGKADILLRDGLGNLGLYTMNGATITAGAFVGSPGAYTVAGVADFNGDGKADILLRDGGGNLGLWIMNGSTITSGAFVGSPGAYTVAGVADFNGDSRADILLRDGSGNLGLWLMNGATVTSGAFVGSPGAYTVAAVADFNGDSRADILLRDALGNIGAWLMNGATITSGAAVGSPGAYTVRAANDYTGDGKADILLRDASGSLGMWFMNGTTVTGGAAVGSPGASYDAF